MKTTRSAKKKRFAQALGITAAAVLGVLANAGTAAADGHNVVNPDGTWGAGDGAEQRGVDWVPAVHSVDTSANVPPASLAVLALLALPGAGGLTILTAAGVCVGYRQAKAGFALRTAGIAGFGRPGAVPLGVVRSGSLVVIRPRPLPVVRPGVLSAGGLLDKVA